MRGLDDLYFQVAFAMSCVWLSISALIQAFFSLTATGRLNNLILNSTTMIHTDTDAGKEANTGAYTHVLRKSVADQWHELEEKYEMCRYAEQVPRNQAVLI